MYQIQKHNHHVQTFLHFQQDTASNVIDVLDSLSSEEFPNNDKVLATYIKIYGKVTRQLGDEFFV